MKTVIITNQYQSVWTQKLVQRTGFPFVHVSCTRFADGEIELDKSSLAETKNAHAVIVHEAMPAVHDNLIELFFLVRALQVAQASKITVFMPYMVYARQSESLQTILKILASLGVSHLITIALHEPLADVPDIEVTNIHLDAYMLQWAKQEHLQGQVTIVAPDKGAVNRAQFFAQELQAPIMICVKDRYDANKIRIKQVQGTCTTPYALIVDDMIDTGSTVQDVARILCDQHNMHAIDVLAVHGLLNGSARNALQQSPLLRKIIMSNSIKHDTLPEKFQVVDVTDYVISHIHF